MQLKAPPSLASPGTPDDAYWSRPVADLLGKLGTGMEGLSAAEAASRYIKIGPNMVGAASRSTAIGTFARQFRSPLVLILVFAVGVSAAVHDTSGASIIGLIVLASCLLSFSQEYGASRAMEALRQRISRKILVVRNGVEATILAEDLVPGDIVRLSAGNLVPADGIILEARDFNVSEATLTGETFPVVKAPVVQSYSDEREGNS